MKSKSNFIKMSWMQHHSYEGLRMEVTKKTLRLKATKKCPIAAEYFLRHVKP